MTKTFGALAIAVAIIAGAGAAIAMPSSVDSFTWEKVFEPRN